MNDFHDVQSEGMAWCIAISLILVGMGIMVIILGIVTCKQKTYEQGQIDAINGKIHYELKRNEDGEEVWVEKEGGKK
jgi:hypothetical protein